MMGTRVTSGMAWRGGLCALVGRYWVLVLSVWMWVWAGGVVFAQASDEGRQRQIEEIRKQIEELSRKLDALSEPAGSGVAESAAVPLPEGWLKRLTWRPIGPANMGGRITALSVYEADPNLYYVATASGGLLKTENNGLTFQHLFDKEATVSIGDVAVAPSDKNVVWVGTGEANPRNSVSYGDGVYKSVDGGKTWKNMGLKGSFQIGRVVIHPTDPKVVYVGALGRLYGPNEERGLFKTTDGGETWEKILYVDDKTGVIDIQMHPGEPETLLVATYVRARDLYDTNDPSTKFGPGAGIHKTTDGGKTWVRVTKGLPTNALGRVGLSYYRKDPKVVYAIVESEKIGTGPPQPEQSNVYAGLMGGDDAEKALIAEVVADGPAAKGGMQVGDVVVAFEGSAVKAYAELIEKIREKKPGDKVKIKVQRGEKTEELEVTLGERPAGQGPRGRQQQQRDPRKPFLDFLGGQRENVQGRQGEEGFEYGGVYRSEDGGESWARVNSLNPRPMYFSQIRVDPNDDKNVYVLGISLYRSSDGGKTFRGDGGRGVHADHHALWIDPRDSRHMLLGCDGGVYATYDRMQTWDHLNHTAIGQFYDVALDTRRVYMVYGGLQDNGTWGGPSRLLSQTGPVNEDWVQVGSGDGFQCQVDPTDPDLVYFTSQNGGIGRRNMKTGVVTYFQPQAPEGERYRWNWNTPFALSSHNPKIYYLAGNVMFRSLDRGDGLKAISKELAKSEKGTATALAESPRDPDVLYVGTDDGNLWVTKDGGREWTEVSAKVGLPKPMCVATIEASRFVNGRVYVAFDGHRSDLDGPFAYASDDYGQTWRSLNAGLPRGSTRCLREDVASVGVLYLGTEFGAYASIDDGRSWTSLNTNLPTVAVHDFAVHPSVDVGEMVAATHGRSLWVLNVTPIRQASAEVLAKAAHLYRPGAFEQWHADPPRGRTNRRFAGENPPNGAPVYYHLKEKAGSISLKVYDAAGNAVRTLAVNSEPGVHRAVWDLQQVTPRPAGSGSAPAAQPAATPAAEGAPAPTGEGTPAQPAGEGTPTGGEGTESQPARPQQRTSALSALQNIQPRVARAGTYRVVLTVDGKEYVDMIRVLPNPRRAPVPAGIAVETEGEAEQGVQEEEEAEGAREIDMD